MPEILVFSGRLHPVVLHLPIGLAAGVFVLEFLLLFCRDADQRRALRVRALVPLAWLTALTAIAAAASGWFLSRESGYGGEVLERHQWMGIAFAAATFVYAVLASASRGVLTGIARWILLLASLVLLVPVGHLGGELTHGKTFLSEHAPDFLKPILGGEKPEEASKAEPVPVTAPGGELIVFNALVEPVLDKFCTKCHGANKQKGGLALHTREAIVEGGDTDVCIEPGNSKDSLLLEVCLLPLEHDERMPPKGKPQPSKAQLEAIRWWIDEGASFEATIAREELPAELTPLLNAPAETETDEGVEPSEVKPPNTKAVGALRSDHVSVQRIHQGSDLLSISFAALAATTGDEALDALAPLRANVASLDLGRTQITDAGLAKIAGFSNLVELDLRETKVTGDGIAHLAKSPKLERLNLAQVDLDAEAPKHLLSIPNLKKVHLWKTGLPEGAIKNLREKGIDAQAGE